MFMFKHLIALIVLSLALVFFMPYAQQGIQALLAGHNWVSDLLTNVFSSGQAGNVSRSLIALLALPLVIGLIPSIIYWVVRKSWFPYFMNIVWIVWLLEVGALVMSGAVTPAAG